MKTVLKITVGIVLGMTLLVVGCTALVAGGLNTKSEDGITRAQFNAVKQGTSQAAVEKNLGEPESAQQFENSIPELKITSRSSCIYYPEKGRKILEGSSFQLCFDSRRLTSKNVY